MIDFAKTLKLIKGGLLDQQPTWTGFLEDNPSLQTTFMVLTGPLILANVVLGVIFSRMTGAYYSSAYGDGMLSAILFGLVIAVVSLAIATFVLSALAGVFGGKADLARAFAALSLAAIPAYTGGILGALIPYLGFVITLAAGIWSLVCLWRILPQALDIPAEKRTLHYVVSLLTIFVINLIIAALLGLGGTANSPRATVPYTGTNEETGSAGIFSGITRQAELNEAATADRYAPPADAKVSRKQVQALLRVVEKSEALRQRESDKLKKMSEDLENKEQPSLADLAKVYKGTSNMLSMANAEMEVVKTGGGNWAEHQWVKEQLRIAIVQQDGSAAIEHNYKLYLKHQEQLDTIIN